MKDKSGGPAFPLAYEFEQCPPFDPANPDRIYATRPIRVVAPGLTKREFFAAAALQGLLACPYSWNSSLDDIAVQARRAADALMAELEKQA